MNRPGWRWRVRPLQASSATISISWAARIQPRQRPGHVARRVLALAPGSTVNNEAQRA
jgi:hypothetical protein